MGRKRRANFEGVGLTAGLAGKIAQDNNFARNAGGKLYRYAGGVYKTKGEQFVKASVKRQLLEMGATAKWSKHLGNEVCEYLTVDAPELWERPSLDVVNVKNGLLRISDHTLLPHSPSHLSPVQLPVAFDPTARCPAIEQFVCEVFPADAHQLAWQMTAWLMRPDLSIQKAILLTGDGSNGKSTWLTLQEKFLGKPNCSNVSLHKLESNRFASSRLIGKLANICPDLPSKHLEGTSIFKAIVGNDALDGEYKHKDGFEFTPFARLVFSANHPPRSQDASHAFFRRWLVIPFDRTIEPENATPRDVLDARLAAELPGLLNEALDALPSLQGGFDEPASVLDAWQEFHATTDPLAVWLERNTVDDPDAIVPKGVLRSAYGAECDRRGRPSPTMTAFGTQFKQLRPNLDEKQRTVNGSVTRCYIGIGMPGDDSGSSHTSRTSRTSHYSDSDEEIKSNESVLGQGKHSSKKSVKSVNPVKSPPRVREEF